MFIQTEETPNPNTIKFLPGELLVESGPHDFPAAEAATSSPFARRLFLIQGVSGVFINQDYVAVTKTDAADWMVLRPLLIGAIMDHLASNAPILVEDAQEPAGENDVLEEDDDVVKEIKELINHRIRPAVAMDGGDITFVKFEDGIVYLQMQGACSGCPSSSVTLKSGIENMLKHYVPEVEEVRQYGVEVPGDA